MTLRVLVRIISLSLVSISNYPYLTKIINFLNPEFHPNYAHAKQQIVLDGGWKANIGRFNSEDLVRQ